MTDLHSLSEDELKQELTKALLPNSFSVEHYLGEIDIVLTLKGGERYGIIGTGPTYEDAMREALGGELRVWRKK